MCIYVRQGLIWLLIATIVEVPPVVRLVILWDHSFRSSLFYVTGVHTFKFEW